jgi:ribosomal protein S25
LPVIGISKETNAKREAFFRAIFGDAAGYVCLAWGKGKGNWHQEFFKYPEQLPTILETVNRNYVGKNVYFCPQLLKGHQREKEDVDVCTCIWADLDECDPRVLEPKPSIVLQSSPGRWQSFWLLNKRTDPLDAEDAAHRIAWKYKEYGIDQTGWDLSQMLRVPLTYNVKYERTGEIPNVELVSWENLVYSIDDFRALPPVPGYEFVDEPIPDLTGIDPDELFKRYRMQLSQRVHELYSTVPRKDWSTSLWALEMELLEAGLSKAETFVICRNAACNKFRRDGLPEHHLWKDVGRAAVRLVNRQQDFIPGTPLPEILTEAEWAIVKALPDTFIERFTAWAKTRGDAAPQYFQAGALTILSHLLSSVVKLPTSFGTMTLNLWFMILADTTLTRKSTAMEMAMDLLITVDPDAILATDGSLEGLMSAIASRPNRSGIFWRDEFSGLLEAIAKKDYYAGMLEVLTKMYDGKYQKRILRKETIEVRDPILLIFCGGIRNRILAGMTAEHVYSGFVPRFIFIEAESDINDFKAIGPMTDAHDADESRLLVEIEHFKDMYDAEIILHIGEQEVKSKRIWNAKLTPEAWLRYNDLEKTMVKYGVESNNPEMYTPLFDRLSKSALKTAALISAARKDPQAADVIVEVQDILRAASYMIDWAKYAVDVVENVGKTVSERRIEQVGRYIARHNGVSRSRLMQNFHLTARDAEGVLETLDQRGMIRRVRNGKGENLFPAVLS